MSDFIFGMNNQNNQEEEKKNYDVIAQEVMSGKWGNGDERRSRLAEAGYDYAAVQQRVNDLVSAQPSSVQPATVQSQLVTPSASLPAQTQPSSVSPQTQQAQTGMDSSGSAFWQRQASAAAVKSDERLQNRQRYGIDMPDDVYAVWNQVISNAENPEEEAHRIGAAYQWSRILGEPIENCYQNLEALNEAYFGSEVKEYRTGYQAVMDMITLGNNNVKIGVLGNQIRDATQAGDTELVESLMAEYRSLQQINESLQDNIPRSWITEAFKAGAQSLPFTGYVALSGLFGNFIYPGAGTFTAFNTSSYLTAGQEYLDILEQGGDHQTANIVSMISGGIQGFIEIQLGNVASALGASARAAGQAASKLTEPVIQRIVGGIGKKLHFGPAGQMIKNFVVRYGSDILEEGAEEVLQEITSLVGQEIAASIGGYDIPDDDIQTVVANCMEAFKGGVLGAMVLGIPTTGMNIAVDLQEYKRIGGLAAVVDSPEFFNNAVKDSPVFEGMSEAKKKDVINDIYKASQSKRDAATAEQVSGIREVNRAAEGFEDITVDEETGTSDAKPVARTPLGELFSENDVIKETDNGVSGRYKIGDPEQDEKNLYGYINYETDEEGRQVLIKDFVMNYAREGLRQEAYENFARDFAGYEIQWDTNDRRASEIKETLIRNNPNGVNSGLTYYDSVADVADSQTRQRVAEAVARNMPVVQQQGQLSAAVTLLESMAKAQGKNLTTYVSETFGTDIFGNMAEGEELARMEGATFQGREQARQEGLSPVSGATTWKDFENGVRAVIYAGKTADFSTWAHELAHVYRRQLTGDLLADAEKAFNVNNGDWIHSTVRDADGNLMSSEEAFAYGFQDWLKTGKAQNAQMKNIFQRFAEFLARCYHALKKHINLSPEIESVYNQLLAGDDSMLAQAEKAVEAADRKIRAEAQAEETRRTEEQARQKKEAANYRKATVFGEEQKEEKEPEAEPKETSRQEELEEEARKLVRESEADADEEYPLTVSEALDIVENEDASKERLDDITEEISDATDNQTFSKEQSVTLNDNDTTQDQVNDVIIDSAGEARADEEIEISLDDFLFIDSAEEARADTEMENNQDDFLFQEEQRDREYEKAVKDGDTEKALRMLQEEASFKGYTSSSDYQGTSAFNGAAPYRNAYFETKEERLQAIKEESFEDTETLGDYAYDNADALGFEFLINDNRAYRAADEKRKEAINNLREAVKEARSGKKNVTIKMYRSVPIAIKENNFRNGDWITPSRMYAEENADLHGWNKDESRIIEQDVDIEDIWWDGNDIAEWGYDDQQEAVYKNTENNRKLFEITYDENGNLIPLSKRFDTSNPSILFQKITDEDLLQKLNSEPTIKVLRAMQVIDGKYYPPMAARVDGKFVEPVEAGDWVRADEHPELAIPDIDKRTGKQKIDKKTGRLKWKFNLDKGGRDASGKKLMDIPAAYNPYWHTSRSPLNDQFSTAYKRPNLVTVEVEVPVSELTSGYHADRAKDAVGELEWKAGPVSSKLAETGNPRKVILSRYCKIVRVIPDAEIASQIADMLKGTDIEIPDNTVSPNLLKELKKQGVKIQETEDVRKFNDYLESKGLLFQVIGEQGAKRLDEVEEATTRLDNLSIAKEMESQGKDAKSIRLATGWEKGKDELWRYEIDDSKVRTDVLAGMIDWESQHPNFYVLLDKMYNDEKLTEEEQSQLQQMQEEYGKIYDLRMELKDSFTEKKLPIPFLLNQVLDFPELFNAYPELKNIAVEIAQADNDHLRGAYSPDGVIRLYKPMTMEASLYEESAKSILLHEVQHAIQRQEGFAVGGNVSQFEEQIDEPTKVQNALVSLHEIPKDELMNYKESEIFKFLKENLPEVLEEKIDGYGTLVEIMDRWIEDVNNGVRTVQSIYDEIQDAYETYDKYRHPYKYTNKSPFEKYQALAGEVEARNVQVRQLMDATERLNTLLAETEDIAREDQIVLREVADNNNLLFQTAYHGSGANFDRFDTENYGLSGEGSMSFGYGTYLTDDEEIARDYAERQYLQKYGTETREYQLNSEKEHLAILEEQVKEYESEEAYEAGTLQRQKDLEKATTPWRKKVLTFALEKRSEEERLNNLSEIQKEIKESKEKIETLEKELADISKNSEKAKRHLYTVEIPDRGFIVWDKTVTKARRLSIMDKLYKKLIQEDYAGAEADLRPELISVFEAPLTGKELYQNIWSYLGSDKEASMFLESIGIPGIDFPAGTNYGTPGGKEARNYVIFNDADAQIVNHLLFQTEQELYDDAAMYDSWQDFMEAYTTSFDPYEMESDLYHSQVPADADAQWYQTTWELAHGLKPEESLNEQEVLDEYKARPEENSKDALFLVKIQKPGELENFLRRIQQIEDIDLDSEEWSRPQSQEEVDELNRISELQRYISTQLKHGTWLSNAMRVAGGKDITPRKRREMLTLISAATRDYRAIYSQIMEDEELAVPEDQTVSAQLRKKLSDPDEDFEEMTPERRRQIAEDISNETVAERIKTGEIKLDAELDNYIKAVKKDLREANKKAADLQKEMDEDYRRIADAEQRELLRLHEKLLTAKAEYSRYSDTTGRRIRRGLETTGKYSKNAQTLRADYDRIFRQFADLKKVIMITAQVKEAMRLQTQLADIREQLKVKQQDGQLLFQLKKLRAQLVKRTMRRVPFERVDYESARLLIAIQRVFEPNLMGGINEWIGQGSANPRHVVSAWLTDVHEREKYEKILKMKGTKTAMNVLKKLEALKSIDDYKKWTDADKKRLSRVMPKEDWIRELALKELAKEREQSIDLDIKVNETTRTVRNPETGKETEETKYVIQMPEELAQEIMDALGPDIYNNLIKRPFREWNTEDLERLAVRVNEIYKEGRDNLAAKKQLKLEEAQEIRARIEELVRDSGIRINEDDSPEEKERKQAEIDRILGLTKDLKGTAGVKKETRINRILHGYADANVRRVARILDNYTDGENTQELYWKEDECWNNRERAKARRSRAVENVMKEYGITAADLNQILDVNGLELSVDDLLYIYAADQDYEILRDKNGVPVLDENGREQNDDYAPTSRNAVMFGNMLSADEYVAWKEELDRMDKELSAAINGETLTAEEMQELTAGILDRHPGTSQYIETSKARYGMVLAEARKLIEGNEGLRRLYETISKDYADEFDRMSRVSIEEFNAPVNRVKAYVPLIRLESNGETNANQVKQDLLTTSGGNAAGKIGVNKGMTQRRVSISPLHQKPVQTGLYKTWLSAVDRTEHFIAYAPYVRELNRVYKGRDAEYTRRFIESRYGRGMLSYIDDYINEVANPNANKVRTAGDEIIRTLRGKTAPAYLAWKLSGILKQAATSPAPYFQFVTPAQYIAAAWECATNHGYDTIKAKSVFMANRVQDPLYDLVDELEAKAKTPLQQKLMAIEKKGMAGLEFIDWACVAPGWLACYKKEYARITEENQGAYQRKKAELEAKPFTGDNMDEVLTAEQIEKAAQDAVLTEADIDAQAVRYADDCTRQCQPSSRLSDLAPLYKNSSEFAKAYLQFQTSLNVIWQNIRYDLPAAIKTKQFNRAVGMISGYVVAGIAMNALMDGVTGGGDDDDDKLTALRNLIFYSTTQFTDSVPLIGNYLSVVAQKAITGRSSYLSTGTDMTPMITKLGSSVMQFSNGNWTKGASYFAEGVGLALGLPTSGAKEIYKFFTDEKGNFDVGLGNIYGIVNDIIPEE